MDRTRWLAHNWEAAFAIETNLVLMWPVLVAKRFAKLPGVFHFLIGVALVHQQVAFSLITFNPSGFRRMLFPLLLVPLGSKVVDTVDSCLIGSDFRS